MTAVRRRAPPAAHTAISTGVSNRSPSEKQEYHDCLLVSYTRLHRLTVTTLDWNTLHYKVTTLYSRPIGALPAAVTI